MSILASKFLRPSIRGIACALTLAGLGAAQMASPAPATESPRPATSEYDLKAAFLFNFAQYVEWPQDAFANASVPIVIGILGDDPFGKILDEMVSDGSAHGRKLIVQRYKTVEQLQPCHILFIGHAHEGELVQVFARLGQRNVLTVGETKEFARYGIIAFELVQRRLCLHINLRAAEEAGLTVSSKLLRQAQIVRADRGRP